jgi:hypothetical protein
LATSRTGDEKRATELAALLEFWLIHGKPRREPKEKDRKTAAWTAFVQLVRANYPAVKNETTN